MESPTPEGAAFRERERTAHRLKSRYSWLNKLTDDELRDVTVCYEGEQLRAGEQYFDLSRPERGVIMARVGETVPPDSCYVAKGDVRPNAWQKLITVG